MIGCIGNTIIPYQDTEIQEDEDDKEGDNMLLYKEIYASTYIVSQKVIEEEINTFFKSNTSKKS